MQLRLPNSLRYGLVNILEGKPSWIVSALVRGTILIMMLLIAAPWRVTRELSFGSNQKNTNLKSSLRIALWIWDRSWVPFRFKLDTFFDTGWFLSETSCLALQQRNFLSREPLKRRCDLAQLKLSTVKQGASVQDQEQLDRVDNEITTLVSEVLSEAKRLIASPNGDGHRANSSTQKASSSSSPSKRFDNDRTRSVLLEFDDACKALGLPYFLVSGTFLGVVRDNAFIGHDHDIDVGVFEEDLDEALIPTLLQTGSFAVTLVDTICLRQSSGHSVQYGFMTKPAIIRLAHRTGISIDIFTHFHDGQQVWHGSSVHRWNNRNFKLVDYPFLGRQFKGAEDFDLYFTENYGPDWRTPKSDFDSSLDTPNMSFVGSANALVFFAWLVAHYISENQLERARKYIAMLERLDVLEIKGNKVRVK